MASYLSKEYGFNSESVRKNRIDNLHGQVVLPTRTEFHAKHGMHGNVHGARNLEFFSKK